MTKAEFALRALNRDVPPRIAKLSNDEAFTPPEVCRPDVAPLAQDWARDNGGVCCRLDNSDR
jgi:hypothetical protein